MLKLCLVVDEIVEALRSTHEEQIRNQRLLEQITASQAARSEQMIAVMESMSVSCILNVITDIYLFLFFMSASKFSSRRLRSERT